jgi:NAD(P)H-hydrate epimerase
MGAVFAADVTVTLACAKVGLVSSPGFERVGRLRVVDIGIPTSLAARVGCALALLDDPDAAAMLPPRPQAGHKGTFGHLLVVAGSEGKTGAALLCAGAGLRTGVGLCTLAVPPAVRPTLEGRMPEVMLAELDAEKPRADALAALAALVAGKRALAWGPGMPTTPAAGGLVRAALATLELPVVLDADALNHLAGHTAAVRAAKAPVVLTPHPGEAARLLGVDTAAVQDDRVAAARRLAADTSAVVVLKGARTIVAEPDGRATINPTGNPGMGTGGAGDVLTGVIGALLAQGVRAADAARLGVYVHGRAGDLAAARGQRGVVAGDISAHLPEAFASLTR